MPPPARTAPLETPQACATGKVRLFVTAPLAAAAAVSTDDQQAHYLLNVMRLQAGDAVLLFNGRDGEWAAEIISTRKRMVTLTCRARVRPQAAGLDLYLLLAPIKKARLDYAVEKAAELGVAAIRPVLTERTNAARVRTDRLRAHGVEAAEQCGRLDVPRVEEPVKLAELLRTWPADRHLIFCDEWLTGEGDPPAPAKTLAALGPGPAAVLIGPEGGFSPAERAAIQALPRAVPLFLGPRVLRADTAATAALALWQTFCGDWGGDRGALEP